MDDQQQLLLWRWSTAVQFASLMMITAFFGIFARFNLRAEVRWWATVPAIPDRPALPRIEDGLRDLGDPGWLDHDASGRAAAE